MKIFKNKVGRPSKSIIKKRILLVIISIILFIFIAKFIITKVKTNKLSATTFGSGKIYTSVSYSKSQLTKISDDMYGINGKSATVNFIIKNYTGKKIYYKVYSTHFDYYGENHYRKVTYATGSVGKSIGISNSVSVKTDNMGSIFYVCYYSDINLKKEIKTDVFYIKNMYKNVYTNFSALTTLFKNNKIYYLPSYASFIKDNSNMGFVYSRTIFNAKDAYNYLQIQNLDKQTWTFYVTIYNNTKNNIYYRWSTYKNNSDDSISYISSCNKLGTKIKKITIPVTLSMSKNVFRRGSMKVYSNLNDCQKYINHMHCENVYVYR